MSALICLLMQDQVALGLIQCYGLNGGGPSPIQLSSTDAPTMEPQNKGKYVPLHCRSLHDCPSLLVALLVGNTSHTERGVTTIDQNL